MFTPTYRAKSRETNEFIYGLPYQDGFGVWFMHSRKDKHSPIELIPETITIGTERKDKNNVMIFEGDIVKMFQEKYTDCSISLLSKYNIQDSVIISLIHVKSFNSQKVNKFIIYFNDILESKVKQTTYDFIVNEVVFSGTALNKDKYIEYNVEYSRNYDLKMIMYNSNEKIFEFCTYL